MDMVILFLLAFVVLVLVMRSLYLRFQPHVDIVDLGDRVEVILYYTSGDGKVRKRVIIY